MIRQVRAPSLGLTLIEMLVVLMIAGMALALGYQSLSQWRIAETSLSGLSDEIREQRLAQMWFEASVRSLLPVAEEAFAGDSEALSGVTLAPPVATPGGTTSIQWSLENDGSTTTLQLAEGDKDRLSLSLARTRAARFEYVDADGTAHPRWPPAQGLHDHLPAAVVLVREHQSGRTSVWAARVAGDPNPPLIPPMYEPDQE